MELLDGLLCPFTLPSAERQTSRVRGGQQEHCKADAAGMGSGTPVSSPGTLCMARASMLAELAAFEATGQHSGQSHVQMRLARKAGHIGTTGCHGSVRPNLLPCAKVTEHR